MKESKFGAITIDTDRAGRTTGRNTVSLASSYSGRHTLDGTVRIFLAEALVLPTGLVVTAFLTRRLGPTEYGLFTLTATLIAWIEWTITSVFTRATVKFVGEAEDWRPVGTTVIRLHLLLSSVTVLLVWILAPRIAMLLDEPALASYLRLFAVNIPLFSLANAHRQVLVGIGSFRGRALAAAGRWIARLMLIVLLVQLGLSVSGAILGTIGASLIELFIARFYVRPSLLGRSTFPAHQLWGYAVPLFLSTLSMRFHGRLDLFALKILGGTTEQTGIYGATQNLTAVPGIFALSFSPLILAVLSRALRDGDSHTVRQQSGNAMRLVIGLLPFAGMTAGAAPEIVRLIFGSRFLPGAPLLAWLIFGALAGVMISVTMAMLTAAGKPGWTFGLTGPLLPLAVVGHLLLIPRLGPIGAAVVTTLSASLGAVAGVLAVHRTLGTLPPQATLWRSSLICGCAYALAHLWHAPGFLLLLKLPVIGLGILLAFLVLGEFSAGELRAARGMRGWWNVPSGSSPGAPTKLK